MKNPDSRQASSGFEQMSFPPEPDFNPIYPTPHVNAPTLAETIRVVLHDHPTLGAAGFCCPFTSSAHQFPAERDAAFSAEFEKDVATVLEWVSRVPIQAGTARNFAQFLEVSTGAVIVAMFIIDAPIRTIPGHADLMIGGAL